MRTTRAITALAAGTLLFAACGGGSSSDSTGEPSGSAATEAPATQPAVDVSAPPGAADAEPGDDTVAIPAALQFSAPLVGGGELDATALAGKPTVFWFWAPT